MAITDDMTTNYSTIVALPAPELKPNTASTFAPSATSPIENPHTHQQIWLRPPQTALQVIKEALELTWFSKMGQARRKSLEVVRRSGFWHSILREEHGLDGRMTVLEGEVWVGPDLVVGAIQLINLHVLKEASNGHLALVAADAPVHSINMSGASYLYISDCFCCTSHPSSFTLLLAPCQNSSTGKAIFWFHYTKL